MSRKPHRTALHVAALLPFVLAVGALAPAQARTAPDPERPHRVVSKQIAPTLTIAPIPTWVLPVHGARLTGRFGDHGSRWARDHTGLDFAVASGTEIHSVVAGTVTEAGWSGAHGRLTVVTDAEGTEFWYAHQRRIDVVVGQDVAAGDVIGSVGSTGNSTGPHLHLEIRTPAGVPLDPEVLLVAHGIDPQG